MTLARYGEAIALGAFALLPLVFGAIRLRRRFLPDVIGSARALAIIVMVVSAIVAAAEALGTIGEFRRIAMCVVLASIGLGGCLLGSGCATEAPDKIERIPPDRSRVFNLVAAAVVVLVAAAWVVRTVAALRHGMETIDTLWYHMPMAARFVQSGSTTSLHYVDSDPVTVFYPATSPLLHGFALQLFSNDFASPLLNLGWLAFALLASWSIGEPYGVAPVTLVGGAIVVATPSFVSTQAGGAYTDIVGLALFLAAVALLIDARNVPRSRTALIAISGLAAGLALGTKFTYIAPVGALTLAVLFDATLGRRQSRDRVRDAVAWCAPLFLLGGYFYVRNAIAVGNPLPSTALGPLHLPTPPVSTPTFTVAQYMFQASIWRKFYVPGLWASLGPGWWAIVGLTIAAGVIAICVGREPLQRLLGFVVLSVIVAYLLTPQFLGLVDRPVYFVFNVRYVSPALALGLCLLPTVTPFSRTRAVPWLFGGYTAVVVATQFGPTIWSWSATGLNRSKFFERVSTADVGLGIGALVVVLVAAAFAVRFGRGSRGRIVATAALSALTLVAVGYPVQHSYLRRRYTSTFPLANVYRWAQSQHDQRIALIGLDLQYPLYGKDDSNYVQYIGNRGKDGAFSPFTTCAAWRSAINNGRYDYVLIAPAGYGLVKRSPAPRELTWTQRDPHARIVLKDGPPGAAAVLLRVSGRLDPKTCSAA